MEEEQLTRREKKKLKKQESQKNIVGTPNINIKRFIPWLVIIAVMGGGLFYLFRPADSSEVTVPEVVLGETVFNESDHIRGNQNSEVVIYEYSDFQCPACAYYQSIVKEVLSKRADDFALVYRNFPLSQIHDNADLASYAAEAAGKQGKFWEMHDKLFENQNAWSELKNPEDEFKKYASELELDIDQFQNDLGSGEVRTKVDNDYVSAVSLKLNSTPTFILDGVKITFRDAEELIKIIDDHKNKDS